MRNNFCLFVVGLNHLEFHESVFYREETNQVPIEEVLVPEGQLTSEFLNSPDKILHYRNAVSFSTKPFTY